MTDLPSAGRPNYPFGKKPVNEEIIAQIPRESLKALFYLFAGKPDSSVRLFKRRIIVTPDDIADLNEQIISKLQLHQIEQCVAAASVKFEEGEVTEFGTVDDFSRQDWKSGQVTKEIALRWDFLITLPIYAVAQRHTLTLPGFRGQLVKNVCQSFELDRAF